MTSTTTVSFEVATDTEIARLQFEIGRVASHIDAAHTAIAKAASTPESTKRIFPRVQEIADQAEASLPGLRAEQAELNTALRIEEAKYTGWQRYYLVNNANGHLHLDINKNSCSSCFPTTVYKWITQASGMDEAELVEWAGERCCTVCFPSAPVEKKADPVFRSDQEIAAEQRASERAAAQAKKNEKAITADGTPVRITDINGRHDETLKTIIAAENYYTRELAWGESVRRWSNEGGRNDSLVAEYTYHAEQALQALAERFGTDVEAQRERLAKKLARKFKAEGLV